MKRMGISSRSFKRQALVLFLLIVFTFPHFTDAVALGNNAIEATGPYEGKPLQPRSALIEVPVESADQKDYKEQANTLSPTGNPLGTTFYTSLYGQGYPYSNWAVISQNYDDNHNSLDAEAADDFVVPESDGAWDIANIIVVGSCNRHGYVAPCQVNSANIRIYKGMGLLPGELIYSLDDQAMTIESAQAVADYRIDLDTPVVLAPGYYWISVQANMDYAAGDWGWLESTVQTGNWHVYRNPGGGWNEGCATWCSGHRYHPDLAFGFRGHLGGIYKVEFSTEQPIVDLVEHGSQPLIYVLINNGEFIGNSVLVINTETLTIQTRIPLDLYPTSPRELTISSDSSRVFVSSYGGAAGDRGSM